MIIDTLKTLLERYFEGNLSSNEKTELDALLSKVDNSILEEVIFSILSEQGFEHQNLDIDMSQRLNSVFQTIQMKKKNTIQPLRKSYHKIIWSSVAAAAVFLVAGFLILNNINDSRPMKVAAIVTDIEPAKPLANIILTNGESVTIDSTMVGLVYENQHINVFRTREGELIYKLVDSLQTKEQFITVSTPKGGYMKLRLSDGSEVSLNSGAELRYPIAFTGGNRDVYAEGEIYFEVVKDKKKPFRVHSEKQIIEVLGTKFNLETSQNEAKTTLVEGSVSILANNESYLLRPGQQSFVSDKVVVKDIIVNNEVDWTQEQFVFDNSSFVDILKEVENWYNVKMVFQTDDFPNVELSGSVSRQVKLSELLKVLEINTKYEFKIEGRRVIVR